jgi:acetate kinase
MKVLVANLGSTSFKYRLFDMADERQLARGGVERVGSAMSRCFVEVDGTRREREAHVPDHGVAVEQCLAQLTDGEHGCLASADEVTGIGFKAVHGGRYSGVQRVTDEVLAAMKEMADVAPAHNPMYVAAMRQMQARLPNVPLVAAFETGFHATVPDRLRMYAVPTEWAEVHHVRRWGFHGASHRYIAERTSELLGQRDLRVISCHLGGSSSLCAIRGGQSVATSMGMSPQTGLPQSNRAGEFDPYAVRHLMRRTGKSFEQVLEVLGAESGLLGVSGTSGDVRDLEDAAAGGNERARLALDVYTSAVRHYLGAYLIELGGCDCVAFTGGIGENSASIRRSVCADLAELGIVLDEAANNTAGGEGPIHAADSRTAIWIVPTNEELVVARQTKELLS